MTPSQQLANRFREAILDGTWIANTNFRDQLDGLDWRVATQSLGNANTIAALAQHIHYYIQGINEVFAGGPLAIRDQYSFDFAPLESQVQWDDFLARFWRDAETFASHVAAFSTEALEAPFADPKYGTRRRNIDAMIEHAYYHLGQIVLLRKLLQANR